MQELNYIFSDFKNCTSISLLLENMTPQDLENDKS